MKGRFPMNAQRLILPTRNEVLASPDLVCLEPPEIWTRPAADFVVDLSGKQLDHSLGVTRSEHRHGSYRDRFSDVLLFGYHHFHGILSSNGRIDCQVIDTISNLLSNHIAYHPGRDTPIPQIYREKKGYSFVPTDVPPIQLEGAHYFGTPIEPENWGMWLLHAIPSAVDFLSNPQADRLLVYMGRQWQRSLLNALGVPDEKLVHYELATTYHCDTLILKRFSNIDLSPSRLEMEIFAKVARDVGGVKEAKVSRRLFLSRRRTTRESKGTYRALLNEASLLRAFADRGYEIVEPELLSFPDQIRLFAEADLVAGLGGAAMFNTIFSPPSTRVVSIESSTDFAHNHADLFGSLGHPFAFIFGAQDLEDTTPVQKRWTIDVRETMKAIRQYE